VDVANQAWGVTGSFVLTGEAASDRGVRPATPFDPAAGRWGALQLLVRYSALAIDEAAVGRGVAAAANPRDIHQFSVGFNWYPSQFIKYYVTFERTSFGGAAAEVAPENAVIIRAQVGF
jgi:phosphate-selective porin OprO/OprP